MDALMGYTVKQRSEVNCRQGPLCWRDGYEGKTLVGDFFSRTHKTWCADYHGEIRMGSVLRQEFQELVEL